VHGTVWLQKSKPTAGAHTALSAKRLRASTAKHKDSAAEMDEDEEDEEGDGANEKAPKSRRRPNTDSRCLPRLRNAPAHATECDAVPHAAFRTVSSRTLMRKAAWLLR
jgi:hypothetical protein